MVEIEGSDKLFVCRKFRVSVGHGNEGHIRLKAP